ncbi:MAG: hypothetical protein QM765_43385 [Myxococcales bacterium]
MAEKGAETVERCTRCGEPVRRGAEDAPHPAQPAVSPPAPERREYVPDWKRRVPVPISDIGG